jgi:hypothetical protein
MLMEKLLLPLLPSTLSNIQFLSLAGMSMLFYCCGDDREGCPAGRELQGQAVEILKWCVINRKVIVKNLCV